MWLLPSKLKAQQNVCWIQHRELSKSCLCDFCMKDAWMIARAKRLGALRKGIKDARVTAQAKNAACIKERLPP